MNLLQMQDTPKPIKSQPGFLMPCLHCRQRRTHSVLPVWLWGPSNSKPPNPSQARCAWGIRGITCKVIHSLPDNYNRSFDGVNAEKRAGYKAGISLELLILLLLPNYNHFHNPAKSRVTIHTRLICSSSAFSIYLGL